MGQNQSQRNTQKQDEKGRTPGILVQRGIHQPAQT